MTSGDDKQIIQAAILTAVDVLEKLDITEDSALEAKKAAGQSGNGEVPKSFYETYSAMANTNGGTIMLGIEEVKGSFRVSGIKNCNAVQKQLWDGLNNKQIVSINLLSNEMVHVVELAQRQVVVVDVPRASREQRPVYIGQNPLAGTFRRNHEGDYSCDVDTVKRMLTEQREPTLDAKLLANYGMDDIDAQSFATYRQAFKVTKPDHPWVAMEDQEFLRCLGGWTRDRETGVSGLTIAGLLMFGQLRSILDAMPNYILDYQERAENKAEIRWIDRITTDGSWSGNLYDFYRQVIKRLTSDLKVPFRLDGTQRLDDTAVHEALREALVNTLIHAEYGGRLSIQIIKFPNIFGFRNPGTMRLTVEDALDGGVSDCRNRNLQKMFQLAGLCEQAGSGIPKIWHNWAEKHWREPEIVEQLDPDRTTLVLRMVDLLPSAVFDTLRKRFGTKMDVLSEVQRLALATVVIEGKVTHSRLKTISTEHSRDLTTALAALVRQGFLESDGYSRGTFYFFPGEKPAEAEDFRLDASSEHTVPESEHSGQGSEHSDHSSEHTEMPPERLTRLKQVAEPVRAKSRVSPEHMTETILSLCQGDFLTLRQLAALLNRSNDTLRVHYLNKMVETKSLMYKFSDRPNHPQQAYRSRSAQPAPDE